VFGSWKLSLIRFKSCIAYFESIHLKYHVFWLVKFILNLFKLFWIEILSRSCDSIQNCVCIVLNLINLHLKFFELIQTFSDSIQSSCQPGFHILHYQPGFYILYCWIDSIFMLSPHLPIYTSIHSFSHLYNQFSKTIWSFSTLLLQTSLN